MVLMETWAELSLVNSLKISLMHIEKVKAVIDKYIYLVYFYARGYAIR